MHTILLHHLPMQLAAIIVGISYALNAHRPFKRFLLAV